MCGGAHAGSTCFTGHGRARVHSYTLLKPRGSRVGVTACMQQSCAASTRSRTRAPGTDQPDPRRSGGGSGAGDDHALSPPAPLPRRAPRGLHHRSEEHTSELQSLMRTSYAVFCLQKNTMKIQEHTNNKTK